MIMNQQSFERKSEKKKSTIQNLFNIFIKNKLRRVLILEETMEEGVDNYSCYIRSEFRLNEQKKDPPKKKFSKSKQIENYKFSSTQESCVNEAESRRIVSEHESLLVQRKAPEGKRSKPKRESEDPETQDSSFCSGFSSLGLFELPSDSDLKRALKKGGFGEIGRQQDRKYPLLIQSTQNGIYSEHLSDLKTIKSLKKSSLLDAKRAEMLRDYIRDMKHSKGHAVKLFRELDSIILQIVEKKTIFLGKLAEGSVTEERRTLEFLVHDYSQSIRLLFKHSEVSSRTDNDRVIEGVQQLQRGDIVLCEGLEFKFEANFRRPAGREWRLSKALPFLVAERCSLLCPSIQSRGGIVSKAEHSFLDSLDMRHSLPEKIQKSVGDRMCATFQIWQNNKAKASMETNTSEIQKQVVDSQSAKVHLEVEQVFEELDGQQRVDAAEVEIKGEQEKSNKKAENGMLYSKGRARKSTKGKKKPEGASKKKRGRPAGSGKGRRSKKVDTNQKISSFFGVKCVLPDIKVEDKENTCESEKMPENGKKLATKNGVNANESGKVNNEPKKEKIEAEHNPIKETKDSENSSEKKKVIEVEKPEEKEAPSENFQPKLLPDIIKFDEMMDVMDVLDPVPDNTEQTHQKKMGENSESSSITSSEEAEQDSRLMSEKPCATLNSNLVMLHLESPPRVSLSRKSKKTARKKKKENPEEASSKKSHLNRWLKKKQSQGDSGEIKVNTLELNSILPVVDIQPQQGGEGPQGEHEPEFENQEANGLASGKGLQTQLSFEINTLYDFLKLNQEVYRDFFKTTS